MTAELQSNATILSHHFLKEQTNSWPCIRFYAGQKYVDLTHNRKEATESIRNVLNALSEMIPNRFHIVPEQGPITTWGELSAEEQKELFFHLCHYQEFLDERNAELTSHFKIDDSWKTTAKHVALLTFSASSKSIRSDLKVKEQLRDPLYNGCFLPLRNHVTFQEFLSFTPTTQYRMLKTFGILRIFASSDQTPEWKMPSALKKIVEQYPEFNDQPIRQALFLFPLVMMLSLSDEELAKRYLFNLFNTGQGIGKHMLTETTQKLAFEMLNQRLRGMDLNQIPNTPCDTIFCLTSIGSLCRLGLLKPGILQGPFSSGDDFERMMELRFSMRDLLSLPAEDRNFFLEKKRTLYSSEERMRLFEKNCPAALELPCCHFYSSRDEDPYKFAQYTDQEFTALSEQDLKRCAENLWSLVFQDGAYSFDFLKILSQEELRERISSLLTQTFFHMTGGIPGDIPFLKAFLPQVNQDEMILFFKQYGYRAITDRFEELQTRFAAVLTAPTRDTVNDFYLKLGHMRGVLNQEHTLRRTIRGEEEVLWAKFDEMLLHARSFCTQFKNRVIEVSTQVEEELAEDEDPEEFRCSILYETVEFPYLDPTDGTHVYELRAIKEHLDNQRRHRIERVSPFTIRPLREEQLISFFDLKERIDKWRERRVD